MHWRGAEGRSWASRPAHAVTLEESSERALFLFYIAPSAWLLLLHREHNQGQVAALCYRTKGSNSGRGGAWGTGKGKRQSVRL